MIGTMSMLVRSLFQLVTKADGRGILWRWTVKSRHGLNGRDILWRETRRRLQWPGSYILWCEITGKVCPTQLIYYKMAKFSPCLCPWMVLLAILLAFPRHSTQKKKEYNRNVFKLRCLRALIILSLELFRPFCYVSVSYQACLVSISRYFSSTTSQQNTKHGSTKLAWYADEAYYGGTIR